MSVRTDQVQLSINFITDESRAYAQLINQNKAFVEDLKKAQKAGKDVTAEINNIVRSAQGVERLDLTKVAPAQLIQRAKQLDQALRLIPQSAPQYKILNDELRAINTQMATIRESQRGAAASSQAAFSAMATGARAVTTALGVIAVVVGTIKAAYDSIKGLLQIGQETEALATKMTAVFGQAEESVNKFAETNAAAIGLTRREYKALATDVGDLLTPMEFTKEEAAALSVELTNQGGILARWSKGKYDTQQATEILNKALLGERDALNSLGIDIKDSLIQDELKRKGLDKLEGASRRQAEALVTLEQITKQSANANADFAKGTDNLQAKKAALRARIGEITDRLGNGLIPVFNRVLEAIIPVVDFLVRLGEKMAEGWRRAEIFRNIVNQVFTSVGVTIANVGKGIGAFWDALLSGFSGNFAEAYDKIQESFTLLNPANLAAEAKKSFQQGWESIKNPKADIEVDPAQANAQGRQLAGAFGNGYDDLFAQIKQRNKKSAEELGKDAKEAMEKALRAVEAGSLKREVLLEGERLRGALNEREYGNQLVLIKEEKLKEQLEVYKRFAKEQTVEALKLQNELAQLEADKSRPKLAEVATIGARNTNSVGTNNQEEIQARQILDMIALVYRQRQQIIDDKLAEGDLSERKHNIMSLQTKKMYLDDQLRVLREHSPQEIDEIRKLEAEKEKTVKESNKAIVADNKLTMEEWMAMLRNGVKFVAQSFGDIAEFLARDEASKKKNAEKIKAFQKAQIQLNTLLEVSAIFANAQNTTLAKALGPGAGYLVAVAQSALAITRAATAISKVEAQKFNRGGMLARGKMGIFGGNPHSMGGTQLYGSDGTHVEVERGELFAVVNKKNTPLLSMLSNLNALNGHGDPYFERGGLPVVNTTPSFNLPPVGNAGGADSGLGQMFAMLSDQFAALASEIRGWQARFKVQLVYQDVADTAAQVQTIYNEASF